jgi:hypothetical protein
VGDIAVTVSYLGEIPVVKKMDIDTISQFSVLGMIIQKIDSTNCIVQVGGEVRGIYTGLIPGRRLFVGTDGRLTHTVPTPAPVGVRLSQAAAMALTPNALYIQVWPPTGIVQN